MPFGVFVRCAALERSGLDTPSPAKYHQRSKAKRGIPGLLPGFILPRGNLCIHPRRGRRFVTAGCFLLTETIMVKVGTRCSPGHRKVSFLRHFRQGMALCLLAQDWLRQAQGKRRTGLGGLCKPCHLLTSVLLTLALVGGCKSSDSKSSSGTNSSLSGSVVSELESNLSSNSSSRQAAGRSLSERSAALSTITLTTAQISVVAAAATTAVQNAGMTGSADLIELLPKIVEGAQGSLSDMGLSSSETIKVIQVIVFSMTKSLSGCDAYLPSGSSASGSTALETALSKVAETSISQLDEAGLGTSDIATASSALVEPWWAALMTVGCKFQS